MSKIGKRVSNVGKEGMDSIRIDGMPINHLPLVPLAHVKAQMIDVRKTQRQNKIDGIKAKYPSQRVAYLESRIKECNENIDRIQALIGQNNAKIQEYTSIIMLCKIRDEEISKIPDDAPDRDTRIKDWQKRVPPYKVEAMETQISQFQEAIDRATEVIAQEYKSIAEFNEVLGLCRQRDLELRNLGAE